MPSALRQLLSTLQHRYSLAGGAEAEERDPSALDNLRALNRTARATLRIWPNPGTLDRLEFCSNRRTLSTGEATQLMTETITNAQRVKKAVERADAKGQGKQDL